MLLQRDEVTQFFKLLASLLTYIDQRLNVLAEDFESPWEYRSLPLELRTKLHETFAQHTNLIEPFVDENPADLSAEELEIVRSWQHVVRGDFFIFRQFRNHAIYIPPETSQPVYGVLALTNTFDELFPQGLPVLTRTSLLPFKGRIIYDGLINYHRISFGPGLRHSLNESYKEAKAQQGIVTSLPMTNRPQPVKTPKAKPSVKPPTPPSKEKNEDVQQIIINLIDDFCLENLNDEYALVCRKLTEKLGRKRTSPLVKGSPFVWASGIVRAVGWMNFLHDKNQPLYMKATDIDDYFGVSKNSASAKTTEIRKMLRLYQFAPEWTLPSLMDDNPLVWTVDVDGFAIDVRRAPRELQEAAFEQGLIPYIPADREETASYQQEWGANNPAKNRPVDPRQRELPFGSEESSGD